MSQRTKKAACYWECVPDSFFYAAMNALLTLAFFFGHIARMLGSYYNSAKYDLNTDLQDLNEHQIKAVM